MLCDVRVAITTSDDVRPDEKGKFHRSRGESPDAQECNPLDNDKPWFERTDNGDAGEDVASYFACRAQVGDKGSNVERPLETAKLSVTTTFVTRTVR